MARHIEERAWKGGQLISERHDGSDPEASPGDVAAALMTDILHVYCEADELRTEDLLRRARGNSSLTATSNIGADLA